MGIDWDPRLKFGVVALVAGVVLLYTPLNFANENAIYVGGFCLKIGLAFSFWGAFFTMRDWKYNRPK